MRSQDVNEPRPIPSVIYAPLLREIDPPRAAPRRVVHRHARVRPVRSVHRPVRHTRVPRA